MKSNMKSIKIMEIRAEMHGVIARVEVQAPNQAQKNDIERFGQPSVDWLDLTWPEGGVFFPQAAFASPAPQHLSRNACNFVDFETR
jgi:hypothetical protein